MNGKNGTSKPKRRIGSDAANEPRVKSKKTTTAPRRNPNAKAGKEPEREPEVNEQHQPLEPAHPSGPALVLDNLSARQPIDPIKEPLRAAALLENDAGHESRNNLSNAAKRRAEMDRRCTLWLENHADVVHTNRLRHQFSGWVELEADPDYFTIMLKRLGIERAKVVEVHSIDEMLSDHHCLKYGIIFLSRYYDDATESLDEELPSDLWFSSQVVDNACATVAILNIINNVKTLDTGENLSSFRRFTDSMSPEIRGEALANFEWCRSIHNAFAKMTEMLTDNLALKREAESSASTRPAKGKSKSKAKAKKDHGTPNHYVAYVPFAGSLWKLDGMAGHPRNLGPLVNGEAWVDTVRGDIQKRMAMFADDGYTVLGIVEDTLPSLIEMLGRNVNELNCIEHYISEKRDYWKRSVATEPEENRWTVGREPIRGPDFRYNLTEQLLGMEGIKLTIEQKENIIASSEEHLNYTRPALVDEQVRLRELIVPLKEELEAQWAKYKDRMFDYGPVIHQWLKFLEENGSIGPLIEWHLKHADGNGGGVDQAEFGFMME